jgi:hypothetical protein
MPLRPSFVIPLYPPGILTKEESHRDASSTVFCDNHLYPAVILTKEESHPDSSSTIFCDIISLPLA